MWVTAGDYVGGGADGVLSYRGGDEVDVSSAGGITRPSGNATHGNARAFVRPSLRGHSDISAWPGGWGRGGAGAAGAGRGAHPGIFQMGSL